MGHRIAIDVGGTFTDVVVTDDAGRLTIGKGLTHRARIFHGLEQGLAVVAEQLNEQGVQTLLQKAEMFIYGTTTATNAVLEGRTAKTAFLTTAGFPDILVLREGGKPNAYDFTVPYPEPYVPRRLTFEIRERINAEGEVLLPLDETHADVVPMTVYVHTMDDVLAFQEVRKEYWPSAPPVSATVQVARLVSDAVRLEVQAVAVVP
jgi:N-methylhydantoinase A